MPLKSEYQRKYRGRSKQEVAVDYEIKLGYRTERRLQEHRHTPFFWNVASDEDESSIVTPIADIKEKSNVRLDHDTCAGRVKEPITVPKREVKQGRRSKENSSEIAQVTTMKEAPKPKGKKSSSSCDTDKEESSGQKPERSKRKNPRIVRRTKVSGGKAQPPLLPYGMSYKNDYLEKKRTFNVMAADEVYPSALRAAKRREVEISKKSERKRLELERKLTPAIVDSTPPTESVYLTEYQRNFCNEELISRKKKR